MKLKIWLQAQRGRCKALADHLGISQGRVSQIAEEGVPTRHMLSVRDFTGGAVSLEGMLQDRGSLTPKQKQEAV